ncbi:MAG TPA: ABC transporter permease [Dehalococcoidia bacterium]|nr:ABC transporter permease [Dehalococcoidia bacterium]
MTATPLSPDAGVPRAERGEHLRLLLITFYALMLRDVRVLRKQALAFVLRTAMQPFLLVFVFGYVLPKIGQGPSRFADVLLPGLIGTAIVFQGIQAVALPLVQEFGFTKEIEDRVLAPLPVWGVALEKITIGALQALVAAVVVFPFVYLIPARRPDITVDALNLVLVTVLACFVSGSLGLAIGTAFSPRQVPLIFSVIVIPITFLGCVYYPWASLDKIRWLQVVVLANPLVYVSEGLRGSLTPQFGHMHWLAVYAGILAALAVFGFLGLRWFERRVVS